MVVDGLPLFNGAQLAIDTTIARVRKERTYSVLRHTVGHAWWVVACTASRAFAPSLLERRCAPGCDGPTPSSAEVVLATKHGGQVVRTLLQLTGHFLLPSSSKKNQKTSQKSKNSKKSKNRKRKRKLQKSQRFFCFFFSFSFSFLLFFLV